MEKRKEKHVLALSGGKDSAALAVFMREKYPKIPLEYIFIDSGCELPETYEYLDRIQAILNINIIKIGGANKDDRKDFKWWLKEKNNYLPSALNRWCTDVLKLKPYSKWLFENYSNNIIHSYVGLRADEKNKRKGYIDNSGIIVPHFPFVENFLVYDDIKAILENSGIGFPLYYKWRTRSGCYFCFYQSKQEWLGLYDNHKDLFWEASSMEKIDLLTGKKFTWCEDMSLIELVYKRKEIENRRLNNGRNTKNQKLYSSLKVHYKKIDIKKLIKLRGISHEKSR